MLYQKTCKICHQPFEARGHAAKYCSDRCKHFAEKLHHCQKAGLPLPDFPPDNPQIPKPIPCAMCGQLFTPSHGLQKYCHDCSSASNHAYIGRVPKPTHRCVDCGRPTPNHRCPKCLDKWRKKYSCTIEGGQEPEPAGPNWAGVNWF